MMTAGRIDSRAWLAWGGAAMVPLLVARHPLLVLEELLIVLAVRSVWAARAAHGWGWIVRLAVLFLLIGVLFNMLTVHAGNQVLVTLPEALPLVGGPLTLNALAYGIVSGTTILSLVLIGTTVAAGLVWADLVRALPPRLAPLAVAGSVAWAFLPATASAFNDIRETQAARGHRVRGARDLPPLVVPLLGGGLERAMTMSEALESRGFGGTAATAGSAVGRWAMIGALGAGMLAAYAFAVGSEGLALGGLVAALLLSALATRGAAPPRPTTRYRELVWRPADRAVIAAAAVSLIVFLWRRWAAPEAAIFNPYPDLAWPPTDLWMLLALAPLLVPAFVAPAPERTR
jgi:energy-coupling factor transport system permease protein